MTHGTTVLAVRHKDVVALGGDGQITLSNTIVKQKAVKIRRLADGKVLAGFAGAAADAITLFERFDAKLSQYKSNLQRAAVELAKDWRTDKYLRRLEALLAVCDANNSLLLSGTGEIVEPDDGIIAIGSGGPFALAAARVLLKHSSLNAEEIVRASLLTAASICIYTNENITIETLQTK
jgi:ATP-dependent HslUV protease subunit HslV